jgi:WD40 repeat protein
MLAGSQGERHCCGCRGHVEDLILFFPPRPRYLASLRGHVAAVYQIAWSADSRLLVSGSSDSTLKVWDVKAQKLATDLPGHADEVRLAA